MISFRSSGAYEKVPPHIRDTYTQRGSYAQLDNGPQTHQIDNAGASLLGLLENRILEEAQMASERQQDLLRSCALPVIGGEPTKFEQ